MRPEIETIRSALLGLGHFIKGIVEADVVEEVTCEQMNDAERSIPKALSALERIERNPMPNLTLEVKILDLPEVQELIRMANERADAMERAGAEHAKRADENQNVMNCFAGCLREMYTVAGIGMPESFDPQDEAIRLVAALRQK